MGIFDDPTTMGLLGLAQGFGQAATPTPYRVPFGAVLGQAAGGLMGGLGAAQRAQLQQAQMDYMKMHALQAQAETAKTNLANEQARMMMPYQRAALERDANAGDAPLPGAIAPTGGAAPSIGAYADRVIGAESGGNPNARNSNSTATGTGQFIDSTWLNLMRKYKPEFAGKSDQEILALRSDPMLSRQMVKLYGDENAKILGDAGLPVNDGTTYLAHWFGPGGASAILKAPQGTPMAQVMPPEVLRANPNIANLTTDGVVALANQKMGGGAAGRQQVASLPPAATDAGGGAPALPTPQPAQGNIQVAQPGQYDPRAMFKYYNERARDAAMLPGPYGVARAKYWEALAQQSLQNDRFRPGTQNGIAGQFDIVTNQFHPHPADLQPNSVVPTTGPQGQMGQRNRITGAVTWAPGDVQSPDFQGQVAGAKANAAVPAAIQQAVGIEAGQQAVRAPYAPPVRFNAAGPDGRVVEHTMPVTQWAAQNGAGGQPTAPAGGYTGAPVLTPEQEAISKAYGEEAGKVVAAGVNAPKVLERLQVIDNAAQNFRPGMTGDARSFAMRGMTDVLQSLGIPPPEWMVKGASGAETIGKEGGFLAAEMTRALGSREAAAVFNQIRNIQPNISMSEGGFGVITNSIRQGALRDQDLMRFQEDWLKTHPSIAGMADAFNKVHPVEAYASKIVPFPAPARQSLAKPGVIYQTPQGAKLWDGTSFQPVP